MGKKNIGERTCMGCGRKAHKSEMLRFVEDEQGKIVLDREQRAPGRGGYFCPRQECFDQAARKRRISFRFRGRVNVDPRSLVRDAQEQLGGGSSGWPR